MVHVLWESVAQHAGQEDTTTMKRHRHTPEQIVRKLREGDRLLSEGKDLAEGTADPERRRRAVVVSRPATSHRAIRKLDRGKVGT